VIGLLDGDIIAYRCAASCEPTKEKDFLEPEEVALERTRDLVERIIFETNVEDKEIYLGSGPNFRHALYPAYKGNRTKRAPTWLKSVIAFLQAEYDAQVVSINHLHA